MEVSNNTICKRIRMNVAGIKQDMQVLYRMADPYTRNLLLRQMAYKLEELDFLTHMQYMGTKRQESLVTPEQRVFTLEALSQYDGKDGKMAYIAVDKLVYDVTGHAAWAAGTHFGLTAGKDVSAAFATCHGGEEILSQLPVVGTIA